MIEEKRKNLADKVINAMKEATEAKIELFKPEFNNLTEEERESAIDRLVQIAQTVSVDTVIHVYDLIKKHRSQAEATSFMNAFMLSLTTRLEVEKEVETGIGKHIRPVCEWLKEQGMTDVEKIEYLATEVMGWNRGEAGTRITDWRNAKGIRVQRFDWCPLTNISDAWDVVEAIKAKEIVYRFVDTFPGKMVYMFSLTEIEVACAICDAAIEAVTES